MIASIGSLVNVKMGQSPDSASYNDNNIGIPLIQGNADIENRLAVPRKYTSNPTSKICEPGDTLISVRAPVGSISKTSLRACIGRGVASLGRLDDFLYHYFLSKEKSWTTVAQGSTFTCITAKDIECLKIGLPSPKEKQMIGLFLSLLDERINTQNKIISELGSLKKAIIQRFFHAVKNSYVKKLDEIIEEYSEKTSSDAEYPVLSSTSSGIYFQSDYFNKGTSSDDTTGYKIVPKGFCTYRSMSDTGEFHFNEQTIVDKGIVSPAYPVFEIKTVHRCYVLLCLNESEFVKKQITEGKTGGTRFALSISKLMGVRILWPAESEITHFEQIVDAISSKIANEKTIAQLLIKQKAFLLSNLFM